MPLRIMLLSNAPFIKSGYGVTTANLAKMWKEMGHEVAIFAIYGLEGCTLNWEGFTVFGRGHAQWGQDAVWSHCQRFGADVIISNADTHFLGGYGNGQIPWVPISPIMEDPLVGVTRDSMAGALEVVTISRYSQRILREGGINARCIPLPIATDFYHPLPKQAARSMLKIPANEFVIGNVGMNRGRRKGHDILLQAFHKFLADVPNARLMIHTDARQPDGTNLEDIVREFGLGGKVAFPSPYDAFYGLPESHMLMFYNCLDLYVSPSLNEGQCLPLWEAFACGNVAVATNATALEEALEGAEAIAIDAHRTRNMSRAWSYEVTPDALCDAMFQAYERWGRNKNTVSLKNREWAIQNVSVPVTGFLWQDFLWELEQKIRFSPKIRPWKGQPKIAHVASKEQNCGIAAYTRSLQAALSQATENIDAPNVRQINSASQIPQADIVHWQHEPAIAPQQTSLNAILRELKVRGSAVVMTYHNAHSAIINDHLSKNLVDAAIVHWPTPGLVQDDRLHILGGMGCPTFAPPRNDMRVDIRDEFGFTDEDIIISTFGFASVGRGHFEVLAEMAGFLQANPVVKLQMIVPPNFLNAEGHRVVLNQIQHIALGYGIQKQVHVVDRYIPDSTVLRRLWMSDVGFLYLGYDTMSTSSAMRFFISSRLPTVITPSSHFADVRFGVIRTDTFMMSEFCQAIINLVRRPDLQEQLRVQHGITYDTYRWPMFAEKMLTIYKGLLEEK